MDEIGLHCNRKKRMKFRWNNLGLGAEFLILFFGIPLFLFLEKGLRLPSVLLLPCLVFIFLILRHRTGFTWKELARWKIGKKQLYRDAMVLLGCAFLLVVMVKIRIPGKWLNLPRENPWIWLALSVFYPVFSAYPQEIIYRTYIFRRYPKLFPKNWQLVLASGITFSFVHVLYYHPVSMILTLFGGLYLARVYERTRSVLYTALLHGILGIQVFTFGLGEFFWLDMMKYL